MDYVSFAEFSGFRYVNAGIGDVGIEELVLAEAVGRPYRRPLPKEAPFLLTAASDRDYSICVLFRIADHHGSINPFAAEGFHYASAGYGSASGSFGCVDKQYLHCLTKVCNNP